jgi:nitrate reductase gamma subunit
MNFFARLFPYLPAVVIAALFSGDFMRLGSLAFRIIALSSVSIFLLGFWNRISVWTKGSAPLKSADIVRKALSGTFSKECFLAFRLFGKSKIRGFILVLTMWSFWILTLGSICLSLEYLLKADLTSSEGFSLLMDCAGLVLLICILFYLGRRFIVRTAREIVVMDDLVLLFTFLLVAITGFLNEGLRLAYSGLPSGAMRPAGAFLAKMILSLSDEPSILLKVKDFIWKIHALFAFFFLAYIPFSKQFHMFAAQIVTREAEERKKELRSILHE